MNVQVTRLFLIAPVLGLSLATAAQVAADPLPGQVLKFEQLPMIATTINDQVYHGHDEVSTLVRTSQPGNWCRPLPRYRNGRRFR